jgi:hypothetical protein
MTKLLCTKRRILIIRLAANHLSPLLVPVTLWLLVIYRGYFLSVYLALVIMLLKIRALGGLATIKWTSFEAVPELLIT